MIRIRYGVIYYRDGRKRFCANRRHLKTLMPGYEEEPFLLDGVEVDLNADGTICEIRALYQYDSSQSGYFEGHMKGLFPGFGGHAEFMAQAAAGGSVLGIKAGSKIVLLGADSLRVFYPVRGKKDLMCVARPVVSLECNNAFQCTVYSAKQYRKSGEKARMLSRVIILGQSVS